MENDVTDVMFQHFYGNENWDSLAKIYIEIRVYLREYKTL